MQTISTEYKSAINAKKRSIKAKIERFNDDGTLNFTYTDKEIVEMEIQRTGEDSKFFGFGIPHKIIFKLLDSDALINIPIGTCFKVYTGLELADGTIEYKSFPKVYASQIERDGATNAITVTAWDKIYPTAEHTVSELEIEAPYTLYDFAEAAATFIDGGNREVGENEGSLGVYSKYDSKKGFSYEEVPSEEDDGIDIIIDGYSTENVIFTLVTFNFKASSNTVMTPGNYKLYVDVIDGSFYGATLKVPIYDQYDEDWNQLYQEYELDDDETHFEFDLPEENRYLRDDIKLTFPARNTVTDLRLRFQIRKAPDATQLFLNEDNSALSLTYEMGANFEGTETLREVLNAIAETTQTIYYIGGDDFLHFKPLRRVLTPDSSVPGEVDKEITKDIYMSLSTGNTFSLKTLVSATELGDNVSVDVAVYGGADTGRTEQVTQQIRNNPFYELREDIAEILEQAALNAAYLRNHKFDCEWRGDPALEIGDVLSLTVDSALVGVEDTAYVFLLNDTLKYNGGLSQKTEWNYSVTSIEDLSANPSNLGEVLKQTYAKVDKQNKEIELLVSEQSATSEAVASLQLNTEAISASVTKVEQVNAEAVGALNDDIYTLTKKVETSMTAEDVQIQIKSELSNGVDKVTTATGFTFNEDGLTIAKTGSEMTTNIDEDGMSIFRGGEEVLTVDNTGVTAYNLHARTYLIVGENSRFEDFTSANGESRTGCFWIGG